ncbi:ORF8 [White sturgeon adenovirus 1]|uniref:ORF8 n=1 Tax=White sturgeon adenovirus 1 TaxID=2580388 RepID=A0A4P8PK99_9ADEN|nr:ORF8 [White sturgeon adenovirus 1]QCQ84186.1 ORF8 [White sturgeon adenovirus 1]
MDFYVFYMLTLILLALFAVGVIVILQDIEEQLQILTRKVDMACKLSFSNNVKFKAILDHIDNKD